MIKDEPFEHNIRFMVLVWLGPVSTETTRSPKKPKKGFQYVLPTITIVICIANLL